MSDREPAMGQLLVVTGPPGAGKSVVARVVADSWEPSVLVEGDAFFAFLARGAVAPWLPGSNDQNEAVIGAAAAAAGRYAAGGHLTVYDGVVRPWFLPTFAAASGLAELHGVVPLPSVERCVTQVVERSGHAFTDEAATRHVHAGFTRARADIDPRHVLVDPPDGIDAVADVVLSAFGEGQFRYTLL